MSRHDGEVGRRVPGELGDPLERHLDDAAAQALVDGALEPERRAVGDAHVARCDGCRLLVASYRALSEALAGLPVESPPPDFTSDVMQRIDRFEAERSAERRAAAAILAGAFALAIAFGCVAGTSAWGPALGRAVGMLGLVAGAAVLVLEVASPLARALRLEIAVACGALCVPLLVALARRVRRRPGALAPFARAR